MQFYISIQVFVQFMESIKNKSNHRKLVKKYVCFHNTSHIFLFYSNGIYYIILKISNFKNIYNLLTTCLSHTILPTQHCCLSFTKKTEQISIMDLKEQQAYKFSFLHLSFHTTLLVKCNGKDWGRGGGSMASLHSFLVYCIPIVSFGKRIK